MAEPTPPSGQTGTEREQAAAHAQAVRHAIECEGLQEWWGPDSGPMGKLRDAHVYLLSAAASPSLVSTEERERLAEKIDRMLAPEGRPGPGRFMDDVAPLLRQVRAALLASPTAAPAEPTAYDEVAEKLAYLRRGSFNATREELVRRLGEVGSAEWKAGHWLMEQKAPLLARITELEVELANLRAAPPAAAPEAEERRPATNRRPEACWNFLDDQQSYPYDDPTDTSGMCDNCGWPMVAHVHGAPTAPLVEQEARPEAWRCPRCGSDAWVQVSFNEGLTMRAQCVPCGHDTAVPSPSPVAPETGG